MTRSREGLRKSKERIRIRLSVNKVEDGRAEYYTPSFLLAVVVPFDLGSSRPAFDCTEVVALACSSKVGGYFHSPSEVSDRPGVPLADPSS